jgi:hypothetical protein
MGYRAVLMAGQAGGRDNKGRQWQAMGHVQIMAMTHGDMQQGARRPLPVMGRNGSALRASRLSARAATGRSTA